MNESKHRRFRDGSAGAPTLINEGCRITGVISGNGDYQVSGEVDGDCEIEGTVSLARSGHWQGTIKADNVVISGHVEGDCELSTYFGNRNRRGNRRGRRCGRRGHHENDGPAQARGIR